MLVRGAGNVVRDGAWGSTAVLGAVIADARSAQISARRGLTLEYVLARSDERSTGETVTAQLSFELVTPPIDLIICGSGPDAIPVARLAASLGWQVTVVDPKPAALIAPTRFGDSRVVECAHSDSLCDAIAPTARTAAVVMSHNYERDLDYLDALTRSDVAYIGVLGPRERTERLLRDLESRGRPFPASMLARLFAPIGLNVGGDGAEAIALSIVAELSAVMHARSGVHLREGATAIHETASLV